jgi:hypothetical protein
LNLSTHCKFGNGVVGIGSVGAAALNSKSMNLLHEGVRVLRLHSTLEFGGASQW